MNINIVTSYQVPEGDGVTVRRLMPVAGLRNLDPFVLWDHFDISGGGFPDHPHRGFEAITYLFDGGMRHADNLGNRGTIHGGGAQRFTAGRGIVHSEFPDGHAHGIQLWINLSKSKKQLDADYQQLTAEEMPLTSGEGWQLRTIVGENSALTLHTDVEYLDISIDAGSSLKRPVSTNMRGLIYIVEGSASIGNTAVTNGQAALIDDANSITIESDKGCRLMWCFGKAHNEPIIQHGPFVD